MMHSCFIQIRTIDGQKKSSQTKVEEVIHAFLFSRLDHCRSMLSCISHKSPSHLQRVENTVEFFTNLLTLPPQQPPSTLCLDPCYLSEPWTLFQPKHSLRCSGGADEMLLFSKGFSKPWLLKILNIFRFDLSHIVLKIPCNAPVVKFGMNSNQGNSLFCNE